MLKSFKRYTAIFYGLFFLISLFPLIYPAPSENRHDFSKPELFNPDLNRLNSMDKVINHIDSLYGLRSLNHFDTAVYVSIISQTLKERFHFGLRNYDVSENWIAFACGKLFWSHFSGIVDPDHIIKHSNGLCSQQTIIFMEILKRKGLKERTVGLGYKEGPGHFLCEVHYNNAWHVHDVTMEPEWKKISHPNKSMDYYLENKDTLYRVYQKVYSRPVFDKLLAQVKYGSVNEFPARKMLLFHKITLWLTYVFPLLFLFLFIRSASRKRELKKTGVATSVKTKEQPHYQEF